MKKLLIVVNVDWFFISHRLSIAEEALKNGWDVYAAAGDTGRSLEISKKGIKYTPLPMSRSGMNIFREARAIKKLYSLYKKVNPDIVHQVALKPIVYGSMISKILKINGVVNSFSGLGYVFTNNRKSKTQEIMGRIMKFGFNRSNVSIIFQNQDDYEELSKLGIFHKLNNIIYIKGSGVDLQKFAFSPLEEKKKIHILFPARMLWDKGVKELKEATEILKANYQNGLCFLLAGMIDEENRAGVPESYLKDWSDGAYVKWIGYQKDMIELYKQADVVVLPSYREGMPKSLIEACAIGRPIVTTNAIGCKECVDDEKNGYLVPIRSSLELAKGIEKIIGSYEIRKSMGVYARKKAEKEFSLRSVISKHLEIYDDLLKS